jgi:hypothetical protein
VSIEREPDELDPLLQRAVSYLRQPVPFPERGGVAAALGRLSDRGGARVRPVWPWLAAAAGLATLGAGLALWHAGKGAVERRIAVRFAVDLPASAEVALIGDFNDWNPQATPLRREPGGWATTVPLAPGRYRYTYVVDGRRLLADPSGPRADDEFGAPTSVITVAN